MHGVQTRDMLPIDSEDDNEHHYEEKQYEPDPSLPGCDHEGASLSCWKSALERSKKAHAASASIHCWRILQQELNISFISLRNICHVCSKSELVNTGSNPAHRPHCPPHYLFPG